MFVIRLLNSTNNEIVTRHKNIQVIHMGTFEACKDFFDVFNTYEISMLCDDLEEYSFVTVSGFYDQPIVGEYEVCRDV